MFRSNSPMTPPYPSHFHSPSPAVAPGCAGLGWAALAFHPYQELEEIKAGAGDSPHARQKHSRPGLCHEEGMREGAGDAPAVGKGCAGVISHPSRSWGRKLWVLQTGNYQSQRKFEYVEFRLLKFKYIKNLTF